MDGQWFTDAVTSDELEATEEQQLQYEQGQEQTSEFLFTLSTELIKVQLLPYLTNADCGALFDSCCYLRPLKQTEFLFKFNRESSLEYIFDASFREEVHLSVAINERLTGKRMIDIHLRCCEEVNGIIYETDDMSLDVSMLGEMRILSINNCYRLRNVSALGESQMVNLRGCDDIRDVNTFIHRQIAILNTATTVASTTIAASTVDAVSSKRMAYAKRCVVYTLASLVGLHSHVITSMGGITALVTLPAESPTLISAAVKRQAASMLKQVTYRNQKIQSEVITKLIALLLLRVDSSANLSSAEAKKWAAYSLAILSEEYDHDQYIDFQDGEVRFHVSNSKLIADEGGITALIAVLFDTSSVNTAAAIKEAAHALAELAADNERNQQIIVAEGGITALTAVLVDTTGRCSTGAKIKAVRALGDLTIHMERKQQQIAAEGGVAALIMLLSSSSKRMDSYAKNDIRSSLLSLVAAPSDRRIVIAALIAQLADSSVDSTSAEAKQWAALALREFAEGKHHHHHQSNGDINININQQMIAEEGGVTMLMDLLFNASTLMDREVNIQAVWALKLLGDRDETIQSKFIAALVATVADSSDKCSNTLKQFAVSTLGYLARDDNSIENNQWLIAAAGGIAVLIAVLRDNSDCYNCDTKQFLALALDKLAAGSEGNKQLIADEDGLELISQCIETHSLN